MSDKYKTYAELKEEFGDKLEEYMYNANIELLTKFDKAIEYIKDLQNSDLVFSNITYKELLEILGDKENGK